MVVLVPVVRQSREDGISPTVGSPPPACTMAPYGSASLPSVEPGRASPGAPLHLRAVPCRAGSGCSVFHTRFAYGCHCSTEATPLPPRGGRRDAASDALRYAPRPIQAPSKAPSDAIVRHPERNDRLCHPAQAFLLHVASISLVSDCRGAAWRGAVLLVPEG